MAAPHAELKARLCETLAHFPKVEYAFAYGSSVFRQEGYSDEDLRSVCIFFELLV